jgi:hypothetical protein
LTCLFDESVPRKFRSHLVGYSVVTVQELGWSSLRNGDLLRQANERFDVLLTVDKNLRYQQNFTGLSIAVLTVLVRFNKLPFLIPMVPRILKELNSLVPGQIISITEE